MDSQIKALMAFLKPFKANNNLTDEEFVDQLAEAILDHEDDHDPCFFETFEDFKDLIVKSYRKVDDRLTERHMRS